MGHKDLNILPDLSRSEWEYLIDEWIFSERDRYIIKRKLLDNIHYDRAYDGRSYDDSPEGSSGDYSRRGRGPGAKRDSMGRYSSRGYAMDNYRD